jgi:hypothetical protein
VIVLSPCAQVHAKLVFEKVEAELRLKVVELMSGVGCASHSGRGGGFQLG